jgi:hypothetical protein
MCLSQSQQDLLVGHLLQSMQSIHIIMGSTSITTPRITTTSISSSSMGVISLQQQQQVVVGSHMDQAGTFCNHRHHQVTHLLLHVQHSRQYLLWQILDPPQQKHMQQQQELELAVAVVMVHQSSRQLVLKLRGLWTGLPWVLDKGAMQSGHQQQLERWKALQHLTARSLPPAAVAVQLGC